MLKDAKKWMARNGVHAWVIFSMRARGDPTSSLFLDKPVESRHAVIVPRSGKPIAVVRSFEKVNGNVRIKRFEKGDEFFPLLRRELRKLSRRPTIAVNYSKNVFKKNNYNMDFLLYSEVAGLKRLLKVKKVIPAEELNYQMRAVKDKKEIKLHKKACKASLEIMKLLQQSFRGRSELELAALSNFEMQKRGLTEAFPTIVAYGKNTTQVHASPGKRKAKPGDMIMIDMGAAFNFRCADITRTFAYGKATKKQEQVYLAVKAAQLYAAGKIRPGASGESIDSAANEILKAHGFEKFIKHGAGHPLGVTIHDVGPNFSQNYPGRKLPLAPNMILTIEPGVYLKSFGVRIEDDILVTKGSPRWLTRSPVELEVLR